MIHLRVDLGAGLATCGPDCPAFVARWERFWREQSAGPVAVIPCVDYLARLSRNARKLAHRALRRYEFRPFDLKAHLAGVEAINRSKSVTTQGPLLTRWYRRPVEAEPPLALCGVHRSLWFGGFDAAGVMRGYWHLVRLNRLGTSVWLFKHAQASDYVLNGLVAHIAEHAGVDFLSYHTLNAAPHTGRPEFKRRIGCVEAHLELTA